MRRSVLFFLTALVLVVAAWAGAMSDEDFFNPADFSDTTGLHHEHLILLAAGGALLMLLLAAYAFLHELRPR